MTAVFGRQRTDNLDLAQLFYANYCEMWRVVGALCAESSVFEVEQRGDMLLVRSLLARRIPHMVLDPLPDRRDLGRWVDAMVGELSPDLHSIMVAVPPGNERSDLVQALIAEGFRQASRPMTAMACTNLLLRQPRELDPSILIAGPGPQLEAARQVLSRVFGLPEEVFAYYTPAPQVYTYVAVLRGAIVGTLCLCPFAGAVGVYSVAVIPEQRRRGIARRLIDCALSDAAAAGYDTAVLSCDRSLIGFYRDQGFTPCWDLMSCWLDTWWR